MGVLRQAKLVGDNKAQCKDQLAPAGRHDAENDWSNDWRQPQRQEEGRGWADINPAAKPNMEASVSAYPTVL
jgi:hypothetical protein